MQSGKYKEIIKVYQCNTTINEYGEKIQEYFYERTTRGNVIWHSGMRTEDYSRLIFPNQYIVRIHKYIDIQDTTRLEIQGKMFRVIEYHTDKAHNDKELKIEIIQD